MTPEITAENTAELLEPQPPATAGMTTKVVKGSLWTLVGQIAPLGVTFMSTPFVIRFLGSEAYGVLLLVGLIPTYFSFADLGMGIASTKFASEAYGLGDSNKENQVVWTATAIAATSGLIITIPIFIFSAQISAALNVPDYLQNTAAVALKIASVGFFLNSLALVLNSPMLARLRMDLNSITQATPKILLAGVTPFVLYFGGGIVGAVSWALVVAIATLIVIFYFGRVLLGSEFRPSFSRQLLQPLLKFGGAWFLGVVAGILIGNLEKFILTKNVSVSALAYYSVAMTFANLATLFSQAALQSLFPAFSQMLSAEREAELNSLFARGIRLSLVALLPVIAFLFVVGRPFLTIWAGKDFGNESTLPFYILLVGFSLSMISVLPYSVILAAGRTDYFAKLYWIELPIYAVTAYLLISLFGIKGAAIAFAARTVAEAICTSILCRKIAGVRYSIRSYFAPLLMGVLILAPAIIFAAFLGISIWNIPVIAACLIAYALLAWFKLIDTNEKSFLVNRIARFVS